MQQLRILIIYLSINHQGLQINIEKNKAMESEIRVTKHKNKIIGKIKRIQLKIANLCTREVIVRINSKIKMLNKQLKYLRL
jgi:hypothetical protein